MKKLLFIFIILLTAIIIFFKQKPSSYLPVVAIANYGPHSSLEETIKGIKQELAKQGYIEKQNINYEILDVGFDSSLIAQMITKLKSQNPAVIVVMTTPVAQFAKNSVKNIPLVFADITDPIAAGLLKVQDKADGNMTGASEQQDIEMLVDFAKQILPKAMRIGLLYSTAEANDLALLKMLKQVALQKNMQLVAIPIDQARDIPMRMHGFNGKVDFIYVGTSGAIQPGLPSIIAEADKMGIPILNADSDAVKQNQVLASFGVDYQQIGVNAGYIVARILKDGTMLPPIYPSLKEHHGFVSKIRAERLEMVIPASVTIIE